MGRGYVVSGSGLGIFHVKGDKGSRRNGLDLLGCGAGHTPLSLRSSWVRNQHAAWINENTRDEKILGRFVL